MLLNGCIFDRWTVSYAWHMLRLCIVLNKTEFFILQIWSKCGTRVPPSTAHPHARTLRTRTRLHSESHPLVMTNTTNCSLWWSPPVHFFIEFHPLPPPHATPEDDPLGWKVNFPHPLPLCGIFQNASAQGSLADPAKARLAPNNVLSVVVFELLEEESASKWPVSSTLAPSVLSVGYSDAFLKRAEAKRYIDRHVSRMRPTFSAIPLKSSHRRDPFDYFPQYMVLA